ncbi:trafficking protein particle complex subunit 9-like, partial [Saccoglossus kowalevskii]|uniref:Trafficking protein particle complex subunit 9-like n=1 Tax=Saccoglossus kowalevskii TaxID=10224 RepID=A0ABM0MSC8_SACKO
MSHADYSQRAEDHQSLLVLLKSVGPHKTKSYNKIFDRISRVTCVRMQDAKRNVFLRYKKNVPQTNNEWGDYQCHRKVLGLLCIGKCTSDSDLLNIQANFDSLKEGYKSTLYDSRCMVFGNSTQQTRPDFIVYPSFDDCQKLEDHVKEFAAAVFWVLESKRLDKSNDKGDKAPLLMAPFEKKDFVGIDTESRNYKKRIQGRMRKHIGDLCLQATMTNDAFIHYQSALLCNTNYRQKSYGGRAFSYAAPKLWNDLPLDLCEVTEVNIVKKRLKTYLFSKAYSVEELYRFVVFAFSAFEQNLVLDTGSYTANGFSDGLDGKPPKHCLSADDIIDKYKETIVQYSK